LIFKAAGSWDDLRAAGGPGGVACPLCGGGCELNFEVLQAMTMMNLKIFHQKDKDGACHCTMLRTESVEA
jgi:hypothetical protein